MARALTGADGDPIDDDGHDDDGDRDGDERALVRSLIRSPHSDGDTLDPFAARHDKRYVFAAERGAVLAYRPLFGVALGSGDPVGAADQFPDCLERFVRNCAEQRLRPVVMLARQDRLPLYDRFGFKTFYLGDEAVLDVDTFTLDTPRLPKRPSGGGAPRNFGVTHASHVGGRRPPGTRRLVAGRDRRRPPGRPRRDSRPPWRSLSRCPSPSAWSW